MYCHRYLFRNLCYVVLSSSLRLFLLLMTRVYTLTEGGKLASILGYFFACMLQKLLKETIVER